MLVQLVWKPFSMQYLVIAGRIQDSKVEDRSSNSTKDDEEQ